MTPNTTVTLYATPFDITNKYVIAAESEGEALAIVSSYPSKVYTDCYWQRDNDFVFRANGNINEVEQYNYCVYLNNGKYNFAFITECEYVNDAMTLVHLELDWWLNFAGRYVFHDSPMIRCHPETASDHDGLHTSEPIDVILSDSSRTTAGNADDDDYNSGFLVTTLKSTSIPEVEAITDYWQGMLELARQVSVDQLIDWSLRMEAGYSKLGNVYQPVTSMGGGAVRERIVTAFIRNGLQSSLVGSYHVPASLFPTGVAVDIDELDDNVIERNLSLLMANMAQGNKWLKTRLSPQFRKIILNCGGNVRELPLEFFETELTANVMTIEIVVNPSIYGNFTARVVTDIPSSVPETNFICVSPTWDRIPIVGYAQDPMTFKQADFNTVTNLGSSLIALIGEIGGAIGGALVGGPVGAVAGANSAGGAIGTIGKTIADVYQNRMATQRSIMSGGLMIGGNNSSLTIYNKTAPLFQAICFNPSAQDVTNITKMFGTYGYMMDGIVKPIRFKELPYWHYYQCQEAAIEGSMIPQRYLIAAINRFNAGIFVFNNTTCYKDFSLALLNHY